MDLITLSSPKTPNSWTRCSRFRLELAVQAATSKVMRRRSPSLRIIMREAIQCIMPSIAMVEALTPHRTHHLTSQLQWNMAHNKSSRIPRLMPDSSLKCTITPNYNPTIRQSTSQYSSIPRNHRTMSWFESNNSWRRSRKSNKTMLVSRDCNLLRTQ